MSVVVGLKCGDGSVLIGADHAATRGWTVGSVTGAKVFRAGDLLIGTTGYARVSQLLAHGLQSPPREDGMPHDTWLVTRCIDAMRTLIRTSATIRTSDDGHEDWGGEMLLGYQGRLFKVGCDFGLTEMACGYDALGVGADVARGVLFALNPLDMPYEQKVRTALEAAEAHTGAVRRPFTILRSPSHPPPGRAAPEPDHTAR